MASFGKGYVYTGGEALAGHGGVCGWGGVGGRWVRMWFVVGSGCWATEMIGGGVGPCVGGGGRDYRGECVLEPPRREKMMLLTLQGG